MILVDSFVIAGVQAGGAIVLGPHVARGCNTLCRNPKKIVLIAGAAIATSYVVRFGLKKYGEKELHLWNEIKRDPNWARGRFITHHAPDPEAFEYGRKRAIAKTKKIANSVISPVAGVLFTPLVECLFGPRRAQQPQLSNREEIRQEMVRRELSYRQHHRIRDRSPQP